MSEGLVGGFVEGMGLDMDGNALYGMKGNPDCLGWMRGMADLLLSWSDDSLQVRKLDLVVSTKRNACFAGIILRHMDKNDFTR
jgi:hypothetical protein